MTRYCKTIASCLLLGVVLTSANALRTGDDAATPQVAKWLLNGPVKISFNRNEPNAGKKLFVLKIWATWSPACARAVPLMAQLQKKYREQGLQIIAVSRDPEEKIQHFLKAHPKINYAVGMDDQSLTTLTYLGDSRMLPRIFLINIDNKIIWDGEPVDLPDVLDLFYRGKLDISKQSKISKLREELEVFVRRNELKSVETVSNKIFAIDPANGPAFRMRLFMYETAATPAAAIKFINERLRKTPDVAGIYFAKLDFAVRYQEYQSEAPAIGKAFLNHFNNNAMRLNEMAYTLLSEFPFLPGVLSVAEQCVSRAQKIASPQDSELYASVLNTRALLLYRIGLPEKALKIQQQVNTMFQEKNALEASRQAEQLYREAIELQQKQ